MIEAGCIVNFLYFRRRVRNRYIRKVSIDNNMRKRERYSLVLEVRLI
jgi:hypothetical protein